MKNPAAETAGNMLAIHLSEARIKALRAKTLIAAALLALLLCVPVAAHSAGSDWMRISLIRGDVQVKTPEAPQWGLASINGPLRAGDRLWVPNGGRVELEGAGGSHIRLDEDSSLQILSLNGGACHLYLAQGRAYVAFRAVTAGGVMQVDTPDVSVRAFRSSKFGVDMAQDYQYTDVPVYSEAVDVENQAGRTEVRAGQMLSAGPDTEGELGPLTAPDPWVSWNRERDLILAERGGSYRYLPPELDVYSYDFDSGGRWVQLPDYGYCWTPTVVVAGWAPYRFGRWMWAGGNWVWISHDPWGWCPYHYGRWTFAVNIGWCWVPPRPGAIYWGPGYVGWVYTPSYVGWVPLAPGEIYYGYGYYGPGSVNITNIYVTRTNITRVYRNVYVAGGTTIVSRRSFTTASPRMVNLDPQTVRNRVFTLDNIRRISPRRPAIRPARGSFLMSGKAVPSSKLPPQRLRNLRTAKLRQSRPFTRNPATSVFHRGASLRRLPVHTLSRPKAPGKGKPVMRPARPIRPPAGRIAPPAGQRPFTGGKREIAPAPRGQITRPPSGRISPPETRAAPERQIRPLPRRYAPPETRRLQPRQQRPLPGRALPPERRFAPANPGRGERPQPPRRPEQ